MGINFNHLVSFNEFKNDAPRETKKQVFKLAEQVMTPVFQQSTYRQFSTFIITTTCPDSLAPSLGQALADKFNDELGSAQIIDMVQGCAGGVSSMILASQLAASKKEPVLLVNTDAAKKATSASSKIHEIFSNGSFACVVESDNGSKGLLHSRSQQYKGLSDVVTVKLGHDADQYIMGKKDIASDPRKHLGLEMNQLMALRLLRKAEEFFNDFVSESEKPDVLLLHQVNPYILSKLEKLFSKYQVEFINVADQIGNCGSATTGLAFHMTFDQMKGKKVMICSFGTGGLITAGMWQF
ncbi:MAG: 3-oxoacyl-[acyl-carrier-protein] synthase III C-terminal domain-containing protein [Bacteroidota bacterium]